MPEPTPEQVRAALGQVRNWPGIARSPQLSELLNYIVEKTIAGDEAAIKAYSIAVDVFRRPTSFDPQSDPIVRVQARRLRILLDEYYAGEGKAAEIKISLPPGRYVPSFASTAVEPPREVVPAAPTATAAVAAPARGRAGLLLPVLLGIAILGAALATGLFWPSPPAVVAPVLTQAPSAPQVLIGVIESLPRDPKLEPAEQRLSFGITAALSKFSSLMVVGSDATGTNAGVHTTGSPMVVSALIRRTGPDIETTVFVGDGQDGNIVWSTTIKQPSDPENDEAGIDDTASRFSAQIASGRGPLHQTGRAWLDRQTSLPASPTLYVCQLALFEARDTGRAADRSRAESCFAALAAQEPSNPIALSARAELAAENIAESAPLGARLEDLLFDETQTARRAVQLAPEASFVWEQQGRILALQGALPAALTAYGKAIDINPANADALAATAIAEAQSGYWPEAEASSDKALKMLPSPPSWYYETNALAALRKQDFNTAVESGLILADAKPTLGGLIVLAAAPIAARGDLVERFRAVSLADEALQRDGVLAWLSRTVLEKPLLDRFQTGLRLAGIADDALMRPFGKYRASKSP